VVGRVRSSDENELRIRCVIARDGCGSVHQRSPLTPWMTSCHDPSVDSAADAYQREILAFRAARETRYRSEQGWLTLVERIALEPGANATPIGTIEIGAAGDVALEVPPGLEVTQSGDPVRGRVRVPASPNQAVVFESAGRRYEIVRRGDRLSVRVRDPDSPARRAFAGIPTYPIDTAYRVDAEFARLDTPEETTVEMSDGDEDLARLVGEARFILPVSSTPLRLQIFIEASSGRLYVPFGDRTNREETYGGGRFLYGQEDGRSLVLDFNRACNPPCAFNPLVTCPLPPQANRLDVPVRAGERLPRGN
jgi:uncharacterized protein (DUF1684 family)